MKKRVSERVKSGKMLRMGNKFGFPIPPRWGLPLVDNIESTLKDFRKKRINVPEYLGTTRSLGRKIHIISRIGTRKGPEKNTLYEAIMRAVQTTRKQTVAKPPVIKWLSSAARTLANVHREGYSHNHPHLGNFVIGKKQSYLIDFKYLEDLKKRNQLSWNDPKKVFHLFRQDYNWVGASFKSVERYNSLQRQLILRWRNYFLNKLVNKYPMKEVDKRALIIEIRRSWKERYGN